MRFFKSIKFRLTGWYLIVIIVLLLIFGTLAYLMLSNNLYQNLDDSLKARTTQLADSFEQGHISFDERLSELVLVYNASGTSIQKIGPNVELTDIDRLVKQALQGQSSFLTAATTDGQEVRLYAAPFTPESNGKIVIVVGHSTDAVKNVLASFRNTLGIPALVIVVLAGIGGLFLANRALKPVDRITRTARDIGEHDLSQRIEVPSNDELGRLASTLNKMIERLESAFERQRQFTADASHELRTPLAVIQAESTLALAKERAEIEYRKSLEMVSLETSHMAAIIEKLLFLARSDSGKEPLNLEEVNLRKLLTDLISDLDVLALDKGLKLNFHPTADLKVKGDRVKLRQLFLNLLENAIKYTPDGGSISTSVIRQEKTAMVAISDTGIGIPSEHLPHIFERFYRVDKARSRAEGGAGLGLAIAKNIAEIHGGKIEVESQVGKGSTFTVSLPLLGNGGPNR